MKRALDYQVRQGLERIYFFWNLPKLLPILFLEEGATTLMPMLFLDEDATSLMPPVD